MAIDDRVREGLRRSMSAIGVDPERRLGDARRRGHRRLLMRRASGALGAAAVIALVTFAGLGLPDLLSDHGRQPTSDGVETLAPSISSAPAEPIMGAWRMEYTCENVVRAFERSGIGELAPRGLAGVGLQQDQLASSSDPCDGAKTVERTVIFRPNGYLLRYLGEKLIDDCRCYQLMAGETFVVPGEGNDPDITLQYRIDGDALTFDVVMPDRCSTANCRDQLAYVVAQYAVGTWQRANRFLSDPGGPSNVA